MVSSRDMFNIVEGATQAGIDERNREFYGKITYPWPQLTYPLYADPQWGTTFVNQELGDFTHTRIPARPRIWIAGCGSNQATLTALKFPKAEIVATDISVPSLKLCEKNLSLLGIQNVRLEEQSINSANFSEEFDFVICTGVIHHNADPSLPLAKLAAALKVDGILELMVYNYYHRILTTAFQKTMRLLFADSETSFDEQLSVAKDLMENFPYENTMKGYLHQQKDNTMEYLADSFLQPVEHSYTVESLIELLATAEMELCVPCMSVFDKAADTLSWHTEFQNRKLASRYDELPDYERWQITNLTAIERSPTLSFYAQRSSSGFRRKSESEICSEFLETRFDRYSTSISYYIGGNGSYRLDSTSIPHPSPRLPVDVTARKVFREVEPQKTIKDILRKLNIEPGFHLVNKLRIQLTTPLFPYLKAVF